MAVKTITIDMEAYDTLSRHKRAGQSFSEVIKEHFSRPLTGRQFLAAVRRIGPLSEQTLDAMDQIVKDRRLSKMRVPPRWW
jgi:predicted CopG family antitoxin